MAHLSNPAADALLEQPFPVLDQGFVRLIDYMGGDSRIVQAARVSYGEGTKTVREDAALIDYLIRHRHTSPLEMVEFTFHLKMPIFVARQLIRHRAASANEISGRYSVLRDEFFLPEPDSIRTQAKNNKQGRSDETLSPEAQARVLEQLRTDQETLYEHYEEALEAGVARELARVNLPLSLYTEFYWKMDLHNLFHFLRLRLDAHAQYEIRVYAEAIANIVKVVAPLAYAAFEEHMLKGRLFSGSEIDLLRAALDEEKLAALLEDSPLRKTRRQEFLDKLGLTLKTPNPAD